jgi:hypothetical protein
MKLSIGFIRCPASAKILPWLSKILRDRGTVSRRFKFASFELTMLFLSQARHLGGLLRASPVPFRGSYFTSGLHPPDATPQRLTAYLYRRWDFSSIPSTRLVAHRHPCLLGVLPRGQVQPAPASTHHASSLPALLPTSLDFVTQEFDFCYIIKSSVDDVCLRLKGEYVAHPRWLLSNRH